MEKLSDGDFIDFIETFKTDAKYFNTISEISKPIIKDKKTKKERKGNSIFKNKFKMYSLDDIKHDCRLFRKNFPKSTDGLWYKYNTKGEFILILVEFKGVNFNEKNSKSVLENVTSKIEDLKEDDECPKNIKTTIEFDSVIDDIQKVEERYGDSLEYGLYLKQFETIYLTIPTIYKEYCNSHPDVTEKDIGAFLNDCKICVFVCVEAFSNNQTGVHMESLGNKFNKYAKKLKKGGIIDESMIFTKYEMDRLVEKLT